MVLSQGKGCWDLEKFEIRDTFIGCGNMEDIGKVKKDILGNGHES